MKIITILCVFFTLFNNFSNNFNYMKNLQEIYSIEAYTYNPNILNKNKHLWNKTFKFAVYSKYRNSCF